MVFISRLPKLVPSPNNPNSNNTLPNSITSENSSNYNYIFTLNKDLSLNNILFDYDSLRRYVCSEGNDSHQPMSINTLYDLSFISFTKTPLVKTAINLNNNNIVNVNRLYYVSQLCTYLKITPKRLLSFSNLELKDSNNNNIFFKLHQFNVNSNLYESSGNLVSSVDNVTIEPSSNIVFQFETATSIPYSILFTNFYTDEIFNIYESFNIRWRIYNTTEWNYSSDIAFGTYSIEDLDNELKNIYISKNITIFSQNGKSINIAENNYYPNFILNLHNKFYTLIEIDYTSSIFNLFNIKINENILIQNEQLITLDIEYRPYLDIYTEISYSYQEDIYSEYYNYMNIDNLITSIPINLFDSLYNHNITSSQEIKLYKEHN